MVGADVDSLADPRQSAVGREFTDPRPKAKAIHFEFELTVRLQLPAAGGGDASIPDAGEIPFPA